MVFQGVERWRQQVVAGPPGLYTELPNLLHYETNSTARGDIRDVMSVGKLIRKGDGPQEVEWMINTMIKYGAKSEA